MEIDYKFYITDACGFSSQEESMMKEKIQKYSQYLGEKFGFLTEKALVFAHPSIWPALRIALKGKVLTFSHSIEFQDHLIEREIDDTFMDRIFGGLKFFQPSKYV